MNRKRLKLYCNALLRFKRSKGYGIHSPFAYYFVLRVLREKCGYYAYADIEAARRHVGEAIASNGDRSESMRREISLKHANMLFRIMCYFNPREVLQIGCRYGVSALTALLSDSRTHLTLWGGAECDHVISRRTLENVLPRIEECHDAGEAIDRYRRRLCDGARPLVMVNSLDSDEELSLTATYAVDALRGEGVVILRNILPSPRMRMLKSEIESRMEHGMTFTNGRIAVIVGRHDLPRQQFTLWF